MSIISLYSQKANDNCFENIPYALILESTVTEMIHYNRTIYVKEKLNLLFWQDLLPKDDDIPEILISCLYSH